VRRLLQPERAVIAETRSVDDVAGRDPPGEVLADEDVVVLIGTPKSPSDRRRAGAGGETVARGRAMLGG
jgi:hypothetical protein